MNQRIYTGIIPVFSIGIILLVILLNSTLVGTNKIRNIMLDIGAFTFISTAFS